MDREKVKKGLELCYARFPKLKGCPVCPYEKICYHDKACDELLLDALELLKDQESWINEIAEYQQSIIGSGMHELDDYEKGKWDGLQIAWNIISEGR